MAKPHWKHLDVATLDFNDKATWDMICAGNTSGVFQIEGAGMTDTCRRVQPRCMEDLIAILALYRPDTMGELEHFIRRKNGLEEISYMHDDLIPILEKTYGCMIYQEQVMAITKKFGGYSDAEADKFRKGIGKKDKKLVKAEAEKFRDRTIQNGYDEDIANKLADFLEKMGGYMFNKGHSTGYAILTFKTAFLKANYDIPYMCSLISNQKKENGSTNYEKVGYYIYQSKQNGINVLNPDVNRSTDWFTAVPEGILYGMNLIKGVGQNAVDTIQRLRPFNSFEDFLERAHPDGSINKTVVIALIKSGAFDFTKRERVELLKLYGEFRFRTKADDIKPVSGVNKTHIEKLVAANIVRGAEATDKELCLERWNKWRAMQHAQEWDENVMGGNIFSWEYETISYHLSGNPFEGIEFKPWDDIEDEDEKALVGGTIIKLGKTKVKRGRSAGAEMAFLSVETQDGVREVTVFNTKWEQFRDKLTKGAMVVIRGKKQGEAMILNGMMTLDEYKETQL
ncbi:helix-hairpin-helix domain-containing protein [Paenibacillus sp. MMO-177]|uniref:helix-hairpin-helix domain-containing protein n=1 Tax=Paenibacillus sp. MMO-177 TaxID=3081289 RepID=UPI003017BD58